MSMQAPSPSAFKPAPQGAVATSHEPGGIGVRLVALIIDGVVVGIVNYPISMVLMSAFGLSATIDPNNVPANYFAVQGLIMLISLIVPALYAGYFYSRKGATLGKMAMGLKVVDANDGTNISFMRGAMRDSLGKMVSALLFMIGYLMAMFRKDKRGLHDLMVTSQVIRSK